MMRGKNILAAGLCAALLFGASGCGQPDIRGEKSEKAQETVKKLRRFDPAVLRADTPASIDAEFAARLAEKRKAAEKL